MLDSRAQPWSKNPYAPRISLELYLWEKENFAGLLIGAIFHGIVIVLFFQCMGALLNPVNRTSRGVKWILVVHTVIMFLVATISLATGLQIECQNYINGRNFPGIKGFPVPVGPLGYQYLPQFLAIVGTSNVTSQMNQWLADALLLYRCWVLYDMNYWVIAFPFLMYLGSWVTGVTYINALLVYSGILPGTALGSLMGLSYFSIAFALNVILTAMIIIRLVLHNRSLQNAMGVLDRAGAVYNAIIAMLVESCALFAVSFLPFIVAWARGSTSQTIFYPILAETQVIAPFLIVLRVANRTALTSETGVSGNVDTMHFKSHGESTVSDGTVIDRHTTDVADLNVETPGEHGIVEEKKD